MSAKLGPCALFLAVLAGGCGPEQPPLETETKGNGVVVSLIVEHDGCRLYRVDCKGKPDVYFAKCAAATTSSAQWSVARPAGKVIIVEQHETPTAYEEVR